MLTVMIWIILVILSLFRVIKTVAKMLANSASRSKPFVALKKLGQMVRKMIAALSFNTQDQKDAKNTVSSTCNTQRL
jgi:hypothetical protein